MIYLPWPDRILKAVSTQLRVSLRVSSWSGRTKDFGSCYHNYNCKNFGILSARFWKCIFFKLNYQIPHQILFNSWFLNISLNFLRYSASWTGRNRVTISFFFRKLSGKPDQAEKFFQIARKVSSGSHIGFNWSKPHALFKLETPSAFKWIQW